MPDKRFEQTAKSARLIERSAAAQARARTLDNQGWGEPNMADELDGATRRSSLQQSIDVGLMWLAAVAAVTLANVMLSLLGSTWRLFVGLMSARLMLHVMKDLGFWQYMAGTLICLSLAGVFALLWASARRGHAWAFLTGFVLYALDFSLNLLNPRPFTVGFQLMGLFFILRGYRAVRAMLKEPSPGAIAVQARAGEAATTAPGWYPDPSSEHDLRFWDGAAWTTHVHDQAPPRDVTLVSDAQ